MDERYLSELFGTNKGYVAVASKAGEGKADWTEKSFLWPNDRQELVAWVNDRRNTDLFICPALRRSPGRKKNDGAHLQWLWADVDFQDIPPHHHEKIRARVQRLGNLVVWSGSGQNCHVYVKLDRVVHLDVWRRLNLGLRRALLADAKHTDNALLRIPGTQNYKPGGKAVRMEPGRGIIRVPARLLKAKPWRDVVVTDEGASDGTWERVELPTIPAGVRARVSMEVDEGIGRYGTRHAAVFQVTAWLSKRGYTSDQIHTLMADFKPGLDKEDSERGYDLHEDISRCLAQHPTREVIDDEGAQSIADQLRKVGIEEVDDDTPADDPLETRVLKRVQGLDVERLARQYVAQRDFTPPPDTASFWLHRALEIPRPPIVFAIEGMAVRGQNVTITGQYKAGKSLLAINLARAMCDHTSFLDDRKVRVLDDDEGVGLWSLEMTENDLLDHYIIPQDFEHPDKLKAYNGRGYGVNILTDVGRAWAVNWLRGIGVWVIDSFARICRMAGVDENDNGSVLELLHRLDEIKLEAGVTELYLLAHTGRAQQEEGRERARGATVLDDWADARWVYTKDAAVRFLAVEGRGGVVTMEATSLSMDEDTRRLVLSGQDRVDTRIASHAQLILTLVGEHDGRYYNVTSLKRVFKEQSRVKADKVAAEAIREAVDLNYIRLVDGPRNSKLVERVPDREGSGASSRIIDFGRVKDKPRKRT